MNKNGLTSNLDLEALSALVSGIAGVSELDVTAIASENPALIAKMERFDPVHLAATFAGLLTAPKLQHHCLRLEALIHLSLVYAKGRQPAPDKFIAECFQVLGNGISLPLTSALRRCSN
jgi:hypothetical protein